MFLLMEGCALIPELTVHAHSQNTSCSCSWRAAPYTHNRVSAFGCKHPCRYSVMSAWTLLNAICPRGFEPRTLGLEGRCSIQLSYGHIKAGDGNRTHVSSLEGWCSAVELHPLDPPQQANGNGIHRGDRIRTCGFLLPKQAL